MKFKTKRALSDIPHSEHGDPDGIEAIVTCWNCHQPFRVHVGYSTYIFECPMCQKDNELDEEWE